MNELLNIEIQQLRNKTFQFNHKTIENMKSKKELIIALKRKYRMFFNIINTLNGIQYKQFLSAFFFNISTGISEPFLIRIESIQKRTRDRKYKLFILNSNTSTYNNIHLLPWNKYNIIKSDYKIEPQNNIRINKEQFFKALIILYPQFIKQYTNLFVILNDKLNDTISLNHFYRYLVYCGDKLSKNAYNNTFQKRISKLRQYKLAHNFVFTKKRINDFLNIFTREQLIKILLN